MNEKAPSLKNGALILIEMLYGMTYDEKWQLQTKILKEIDIVFL